MDRLRGEMTQLTVEIEPGQYKIFRHPFPEYLPQPGRFQNNLALVARFELNQPAVIDGEALRGPVFEFCFIRDDRECKDDPSTMHINVAYRILGANDTGEIFQGSYRKGDHFISPVCSTAMGFIETNRNLTGLPDTGPISALVERGVLLELCKTKGDNRDELNEE